jgi:hypothetical protein
MKLKIIVEWIELAILSIPIAISALGVLTGVVVLLKWLGG